MNKLKNDIIKRKLIVAENKEKFVFKKNLYTPFIGDCFVESKERILFIGDQKIKSIKDVLKIIREKSNSISNVCGHIIHSSEKINNYIELTLNTKIENIAYYNFFYDRIDDGVIIPNSGAKGEKLEMYHQALALVIEVLNPKRIIFWGKDVLTKVNRARRPKSFGGQTFKEFTQYKNIIVESVNIHNINTKKQFQSEFLANDKSELETCIDDIQMISREMYTTLEQEFGSNNKQINALNEMYYNDINPGQELFADGMYVDEMGTWSFFMCLKKINEIHRSLLRLQKKIGEKKAYQTREELKMERTVFNIQWMLDLLQKNNLFIAHTLVPSMLKYIKKTLVLNDEMIPQLNSSVTPSIKGFDDYLKKNEKTKANGIENILKGVYLHFKFGADSKKRAYATIMKKHIFVCKAGSQFTKLIDANMLSSFKNDKSVREWNPNNFTID